MPNRKDVKAGRAAPYAVCLVHDDRMGEGDAGVVYNIMRLIN